MKYIHLFILVLSWNLVFAQSQMPSRLDRAHSYFGVHFDFHAGTDCNEIGKRVNPGMVNEIIDQIKPDFIQIDCKGHPGYSSYPTKIGNPAPGFIGDPLKIWREATAARGVALYMHYSGVYDMRAVQLHPCWAVINADGKASDQYTSVFGPYADSLMIPQFKELSSVYGVDGIWVDGDCWAHQIDYSPAAKKEFSRETGISNIPAKAGEAHWKEYLDFNRQAFRNYLNHYVNELHQYNPKFQIASNWSYTTFMPEPVSAPIDFISGDFSATNSLNSARFEGRFIRNQGKPWDLMAWGFSWLWNQSGTMSVKTPIQIERELASVMSLGGGVQVYMRQQRDGSVYRWALPILSDVSKFVRARQPWCQYAKAIPQIGLILPSDVLYDRTNKPFSSYDYHLAPMQGILRSLLTSQQVVDVVADHQLTDINKYPLLIYPEWDSISPVFRQKLLKYVSSGGKLLIIGPKAASLFKDELKVTFKGNPEIKTNGLAYKNILADVQSLSQVVVPGPGAVPFGKYYYSWDMEDKSETAATIANYGKGRIGALYMNIGDVLLNRNVTVVREFLNALVKELFPDPIVEVNGSHLVDITTNKLNGKLIVNLVNTAGPHDNESILVYDEIPAILNLTIFVKYPTKPRKVMLQPSNIQIPYQYINGKIHCTLKKLDLHEMIVIE